MKYASEDPQWQRVQTVSQLIEALRPYRGRLIRVDYGQFELGVVVDLVLNDGVITLDVVPSTEDDQRALDRA